MKKTFLGILINFSLMPLSCSEVREDFFVKEVHDGDTITLDNDVEIRFFGIDTPEISYLAINQKWKPTKDAEYYWAVKARDWLRNKILNKDVKIKKLTEDKYKRTVAKVIYKNNDLGLSLLKEGLARVHYIDVVNKSNPFYSSDYDYYKKLTEAQHWAWKNKIGIWNSEDLYSKVFSKA